MRTAIVVSNAPASPDAFLPSLTRPALLSRRGLVRVYGDPGVVAIPAPHPNLPIMSFDPLTSPSNNAPDVIYPTIYIAETDNMGPWAGMGAAHVRRSDQEIPETAPQPVPQAPQSVSRRARIGGQRVWPNPRVVTKYPGGC